MTGSIQEKNGKYYTVLNIKDKNGKYKKKWQTTGLPVKGNKRKAEQILRRRIAEYEANQLQTPKNLLLRRLDAFHRREQKEHRCTDHL